MAEEIGYTLRLPAPETHAIEVEARFPTGGKSRIELVMAVWTPGSYLLREFSRQIEEVTAQTERGEPLRAEKTHKNRWQLETRGEQRVIARYRLYARELSVRTNFVDAGFALINGAATFLTLAREGGDGEGGEGEGGGRPHEVRLFPPAGWRTSVSSLRGVGEATVERAGETGQGAEDGSGEGEGGRCVTFRAASFDELVDSPIYCGNGRVHRFEVAGRTHFLVNEGEDGTIWDGARSASELERLVREHTAFWECVPYERYVFFNLITESIGGLEHRNSCVLMTSRWRGRNREGWLDWLGLASHELFHAWNGKRLRPAELGPFDYERETYTRSLWQVEGITAYYDDLLVRRAGLSTRGEYLKQLSKQIETLQTSPGRLVQSLAAASFDTWIKYYRRDENFVNAGISYYVKGALVAFLLDAALRRATAGNRSLDDLLRLAYHRFSGPAGYHQQDFRAAASELAGIDLGPFFHATLETTAELDYAPALGWFGLRFADSDDRHKKSEDATAYLGIEAEIQPGRLHVTQVRRDTPAFRAGLNVGDEILAIGGYRIPPEGLRDRLKCYRPGESTTLLVARRERLLELPFTFGESPRPRCRLELDPAATPEQRAQLAAWLRSE
ncbi:MAG TPA: PDZ domain-containing protein [Thermoanaerobaculia bacterium]|nr:PDZ domain-containing protein [Thermoanaerobaculia bacterium]